MPVTKTIVAGVLATGMASALLLPAATPAIADTSDTPWAVSMGDSYISGEGGVYTNKHIGVPPAPAAVEPTPVVGESTALIAQSLLNQPVGTLVKAGDVIMELTLGALDQGNFVPNGETQQVIAPVSGIITNLIGGGATFYLVDVGDTLAEISPIPDGYFWGRDTMGGLPELYFDNADGSGEQIPFCDRSPFAPGYIEGYQTLNLACSGAEAVSKISGEGDQSVPKPGIDFAELEWRGMTIPGQAKMLEDFAQSNDVEVIFLSIGGNDYGFIDLATSLALSFSGAATPITLNAPNESFGKQFEAYNGDTQKLVVAERVKFAVTNITTAMSNAGKGPSDYKIVFQSVPRPVPNGPDFYLTETTDFIQLPTAGIKIPLGGCPVTARADGDALFGGFGIPTTDVTPGFGFYGDAEWVYDTVFPKLIEGQRTGVENAVAELGAQAPLVVFNDVTDSMVGHELCSKEVVRQTGWEATEYSWPDNPPVYGPGQGEDTEWINAIGLADNLAGGAQALLDLQKQPRQLIQGLHPNFWGQRALASCNEKAAASGTSYVQCLQDPAGGTDAQGRPLMQSVVPAAFTSMAPVRVVDTRDGEGPLAAGTPLVVDLSEVVPAGATAVSFNVTVTGQTASGFAEVSPAGAASGSSTVNWGGAQQTIANGHITKLGAGNQIQVTVEGTGTAEVIIDITGVFTAGDGAGFTPADRRVYDSRDGDGPLAPGESRTLNINNDVRALADSVAPTAAAVNVTITGTKGSGVLAVAKDTTADTSTINWTTGNQTMANAVITDVTEDGSFTVTNNGGGETEVIVDLTGTFTPGQGAWYYAVDPARSYDSRTETPLTDTRPRTTMHPVPEDAIAIAVNTTITGTTGSGWLSVSPNQALPLTSTINWFDSPTTRANGSISGVTETATTSYVGGFYSTHYLLDITGYFANPQAQPVQPSVSVAAQ